MDKLISYDGNRYEVVRVLKVDAIHDDDCDHDEKFRRVLKVRDHLRADTALRREDKYYFCNKCEEPEILDGQ